METTNYVILLIMAIIDSQECVYPVILVTAVIDCALLSYSLPLLVVIVLWR